MGTKVKKTDKVLPIELLAEVGMSLFKDQAIQLAVQQGISSVVDVIKQGTADLDRVVALEKKVATLEHAIHLMVETRVKLGQMEDPFNK